MAMQFYASPEQIMRDRSEYARKGIARGRSVVVLTYAGGVLFVAENPSTALHKVSEIYDRIGFAAVGRYNEFENLRIGRRAAWPTCAATPTTGGTSPAGRWPTRIAQTLGSIFTEQQKPFEVEICVAEVGGRRRPTTSSTGSPTTVRSATSRASWRWAARPRRSPTCSSERTAGLSLAEAVRSRWRRWRSVGGEGGKPRDDRRDPARGRRRSTARGPAHVPAAPRRRASTRYSPRKAPSPHRHQSHRPPLTGRAEPRASPAGRQRASQRATPRQSEPGKDADRQSDGGESAPDGGLDGGTT